MTFDVAAHRLGAAVTLLSLDRVLPYYTAMGLMLSQDSAPALRDCIRDAVTENRRAFAANSSLVPDLMPRLIPALDRWFTPRATAAWLHWYERRFVHGSGDRWHGKWKALLALSRRNAARWSALGLPAKTSDRARQLFIESHDTSDIKAIDEQQEDQPLSEWDAQMYAVHQFDYEQGTDPFMWVRETVEKHRFMVYLHWLREQLSAEERRRFVAGANELARTIETFKGSAAFTDPFDNPDIEP